MGDSIIYPENGANGENLIRKSQIVIEPKPMIYSLRAEISEGNKINVVLPIPEDSKNSWSFFKYCGMSVGWDHIPIQTENGHEMHFVAGHPGYADLPVYFWGHNNIEIKIYENDDQTPSWTKIIKW